MQRARRNGSYPHYFLHETANRPIGGSKHRSMPRVRLSTPRRAHFTWRSTVIAFLTGLAVLLPMMDVARKPGLHPGGGRDSAHASRFVAERGPGGRQSGRPSGPGRFEGRGPGGPRGGPPMRPGFDRGGEDRRGEERRGGGPPRDAGPRRTEGPDRGTDARIADLEKRVTELLGEIRKLRGEGDRRPGGPSTPAFGQFGRPGTPGFQGMPGFRRPAAGSRERPDDGGRLEGGPGRGFRGFGGWPMPDMRDRDGDRRPAGPGGFGGPGGPRFQPPMRGGDQRSEERTDDDKKPSGPQPRGPRGRGR